MATEIMKGLHIPIMGGIIPLVRIIRLITMVRHITMVHHITMDRLTAMVLPITMDRHLTAMDRHIILVPITMDRRITAMVHVMVIVITDSNKKSLTFVRLFLLFERDIFELDIKDHVAKIESLSLKIGQRMTDFCHLSWLNQSVGTKIFFSDIKKFTAVIFFAC